MKYLVYKSVPYLAVALLAGCAVIDTGKVSEKDEVSDDGVFPEASLVTGKNWGLKSNSNNSDLKAAIDEPAGENSWAYKNLEPIDVKLRGGGQVKPPRERLQTNNKLTVAADNMPIESFIHYIFEDLLNVNYVLGSYFGLEETSNSQNITLSIADPLSSKELFDTAVQVLDERGFSLKFGNGSYFIYRKNSSVAAPQVLIGMGRTESSVPNTTQKILQVIPIKFGIKVSLERSLRSLGNAKITPDFQQSTIFAEGSRAEILRVIELVDLLDTPATRGRYIGMVELTYMLPQEFSKEVLVLLGNEGIAASTGLAKGKNLVLVPLEQLGAVAVFATDEFLLQRTRYWASIIDVPSRGDVPQYFVYNPQYARASDISISIGELLGAGEAGKSAAPSSTGAAPPSGRVGSRDQDFRLVVDKKANTLIFFMTGIKYRELLPLLKKIDVMPRQVMLDIVIAEVSLKDEFKFGVEWAVNRGEVNLTTQGAFGALGVGGLGLVIEGADGPLQANSLATNSLVKVLSNPSMMVRDGTSAQISVGSTISVVGQTTQDPINGDRQTTSSEYRKTGVDVSVSVSINAAGIVAMEVAQSISNSVPGSTGVGGNPDIFVRTISTEVIAFSGQTVILGGLISETASNGGSGVPFMSKIPILGGLFKTESKSSDRTELVMLITPKVLNDLSGWDELLKEFRSGLRNLN